MVHALLTSVLSDPSAAKVMVMICWVMITRVTRDMHLCVNTQYQAALRGPGYGHGCVYSEQDHRCRVMGYVTKLAHLGRQMWCSGLPDGRHGREWDLPHEHSGL